MSKICNNCQLPCKKKGHPKNGCHITTRRKLREKISLPHIGKQNFWEGVLTRTQIASQNNIVKNIQRENKEMRKKNKEMEDKLKKIEEGKAICVICQEQCMESKENSTPCGHVFHTGCLLGWLKTNNTCPCCRAELYDKPETPCISDLQNVVDNVFQLHLDVNSESTESINIQPRVLYNLGDTISRLSVEEALDIDLDWMIDFEEDTVIAEEETSGEEEEKQGEVIDLTHEDYESSSDMELDTPPRPVTPYPLHTLMTPTSDNSYTEFNNWEKFSKVLDELRVKSKFKNTMDRIMNEPTRSLGIRV